MIRKRLIASIITIVLVISSLAGCSKKGTEEKATNSDSGKSETTEVSNDNSAETEVSDNTAETEIKLPLTDEPVTLRIWMPMDTNFAPSSSDYNDSAFFKEMEKRTGVHLEFETPAMGEETNAFNLMIASGELPDIICYAQNYPDGLDAAVDDGYYLDLTPYMDTYLTHYNKFRTKDEYTEKATKTDAGKIAAVYCIYTEPQNPWAGLQVRKDWLDDLGLDVPVTYDDWEEMLTAFKEKKGAYAPLALGSLGYTVFGELSAGFGVTSDFINVDGTVTYGPITDGWRQYLSKMADWYKKGLINPDYMTAGSFIVDTELVTSGQTGAWYSMYTMPSLYEQMSGDANMNIIGVKPPVVNEGDETNIRLATSYLGAATAISADSEHKELAMQWLDYLFSEEGSLLANYGIENDTFTYNAEGKPVFTDKISKNPDGLSVSQAMCYYTLVPNNLASAYDWTRELSIVPEKDQEMLSIWGSSGESYVMPSALSHTSDESKELASIYTDIQTYVNECTNKFITGVMDVNGADWDNYVSSVKSMNIDRCIEIKQAALNRYNGR